MFFVIDCFSIIYSIHFRDFSLNKENFPQFILIEQSKCRTLKRCFCSFPEEQQFIIFKISFYNVW